MWKQEKVNRSELKKISSSTLISIIVHGANHFGLQIAENLTEQGSRVIVLDSFNQENKSFVTKLKKNPKVDFVAFEGIEDLYSTLGRFDYLFYLQNEFLKRSSNFESSDFLEESDRLNKSLQYAQEHQAKATLVTTVQYNKSIVESSFKSRDHKPAPYSHEEFQKYAETLVAEYHDKSGLSARIIRLGALISENFQAETDPEIRSLFKDAVKKAEINIKGEGLDNHYIVHPDDAIYGILKLTFTGKTEGDVITLANPKPYTTLSIAYKLLELNINAHKIKFIQSEDSDFLMQEVYTPAPNATEYGWGPKVTIEEAFIEALKTLYKDSNKKWEKEKVSSKPAKSKSSHGSKTKKVTREIKTPLGKVLDKLFLPFTFIGNKVSSVKTSGSTTFKPKNLLIYTAAVIIFSVISYFLLTPIFSIGINGYRIYRNSRAAYTDIQQLDFVSASEKFESMNQQFESVETGVDRLEWAFILTRQEDLYQEVSELTFATKYALLGAEDLSAGLKPFAEYIQNFDPAIDFQGNTTNNPVEYTQYLQELDANKGKLQNAAYNLELASSIVGTLEVQSFPKRLQPKITELKDLNRTASNMLIPFNRTVEFLPSLLGNEERQRYLVLLQNPSELRATGGWLSSYAVIGIENGQIRELRVDDIYNIEGQLAQQGKRYSPPTEMQKALDISSWSMSLSNWHPDFPTTASNAEFFIKEAEVAYEIDGVIAIDVSLVQMLLQQWGELEVQGESEPVTAENLYSKIFEIHNEFTPGSQRKSTFIANLSSAVLTRLLSSGYEGYRDLSEVLYNGLEQKHILISLDNREANRYLAKEGWNGSISNFEGSSPLTVEWNWGANKANLYLDKTHDYSIEVVNDQQINYTYELSVSNNSETRSYPEGDYENWMRIYLPESAEIIDVSGFSTPNYSTYIENKYKVVAGWFNTPIQSSNRLIVQYSINSENSKNFPLKFEGDNISSTFALFQQPGIFDDTYQLNIIYPSSWAVVEDSDMTRSLNSLSRRYESTDEKKAEVVWEYE